MEKSKAAWKTEPKERISYALFFLGQNLFYMFLYLYLSFYYTEVVLLPAAAGLGRCCGDYFRRRAERFRAGSSAETGITGRKIRQPLRR